MGDLLAQQRRTLHGLEAEGVALKSELLKACGSSSSNPSTVVLGSSAATLNGDDVLQQTFNHQGALIEEMEVERKCLAEKVEYLRAELAASSLEPMTRTQGQTQIGVEEPLCKGSV